MGYKALFALKRAAVNFQEKAAAMRMKAKQPHHKAQEEQYKLESTGQWKLARPTVADKKTTSLAAVNRGRRGQKASSVVPLLLILKKLTTSSEVFMGTYTKGTSKTMMSSWKLQMQV